MSYTPYSDRRARKSYAGPGEYMDDIAPIEYLPVLSNSGESEWLSIFPSVPGRESFDEWLKSDTMCELSEWR